ncbi:MAG: hypothetical protein O2968_04595 [Acidobacteria bacterium]|nr:hypothetical protein [Acidobacteriota bacterium]
MRSLKRFGPLLLLLPVPLFAADAGVALVPSVRSVWADAKTNLLGAPSLDGRYLSLVDVETGDLAVLDLADNDKIRLTSNPPGSKQFAYFSAISPDSSRVAYAWFNEEEFYELRLVALADSEGRVEPGEPRVLIRNPEAGFVQPCSWSPDGEQILTLLFRKDNISQIALVSARDGSIQVLKSLNWVYPKKMEFSPDGRFIVYDSTTKEGSDARDIFLLSADGSSEVKLIDAPSNDIFPAWTPDGKFVVFASDRAGTMDAWIIPVAAGEAAGPPRLLKKELGRFLPMGITSQGAFYYGLRTGHSDVYTAALEEDAAGVRGEPVIVQGRLTGANTAPAWSPDGRRLAYLSRWGTENYAQESRVISIRDFEGGKEHTVSPKLAYMERLRWAPGGESLLVSGSDGKSRAGLFTVNATTGETTPLVRERSTNFRGFEGVWSPDGKAIYYIHEDSAQGFSIRRMVIETYEEETLHSSPAALPIHDLALSPDGRSLAFATRDPAIEKTEILQLLPVGGGAPRKLLTARNAVLNGVEWLPDGSALLVGAPGEPTPSIWKIAVSGAKPEQLPIQINHTGGFRLDPKGRRIAFAAGEQQSEVWVMTGFLPHEQTVR